MIAVASVTLRNEVVDAGTCRNGVHMARWSNAIHGGYLFTLGKPLHVINPTPGLIVQ